MQTIPGAISDGEQPLPSSKSSAVSLTGGSAAFRNGEDISRGLPFEAQAGAVVSILGPAGAGKSVLMEVLRLALPPSGGKARILGIDPARLTFSERAKTKRRIGFVHQTPALLDHLTAFDNVA